MATGTPITIPIGTDETFTVTLLDENANPITSYTTSDTPFAQVWAGQDQPVLLTPTATWISAPAGTIQLAISATSTASLSPGKYRLRVGVVTAGGARNVIPDTFIEFTSSPGNATTLPTYCAFADMLLYAPWIEDEQSTVDETGFARQRNRARQWLDNVIQRNRFNNSTWGTLGLGGTLYMGGWSGWFGQGQDDPVLQGYLDTNLLMVAEPRIVVEMNAKKALGYVCKTQVGPNDKDTTWQRMGDRFDAEAEELAMRYTAEIDLNDDGYADLIIPCGRATLR